MSFGDLGFFSSSRDKKLVELFKFMLIRILTVFSFFVFSLAQENLFETTDIVFARNFFKLLPYFESRI